MQRRREMKDTIVFCLETDTEESYAEIAKFIYKRERKESFLDAETSRVTFKYYLNNKNTTSRDWAQSILNDKGTFFKITEPQNIKKITQRFEIIYCICVNEKTDIIDISNLYLIKQHYSDLNIIVLFPQCDDSTYHTVSQFLYSVAVYDNKFYNDCYYQYNGTIQRGQIKNISFSRAFTPLQIIDKNNIERLFQSCEQLITEDYFASVFFNNRDEGGYDDLLCGAIKLLNKNNRKAFDLYGEQYIQVFQKLDVLAFVLLCYLISESKKQLSLDLLRRYAYQMQQYSNAVRQLAENIIFHSKEKCGVIAFRMHGRKSTYISEKYQIENDERMFLEIRVSDFCRDNTSGNLADNFVLNLDDTDAKALFSGMKPRDFFGHCDESIIENAWEQYYHNPDNIGKHFGLRIFQSVVSSFGGMFGAESHSSYVNEPGDLFLSYEGNVTTACMPGTRYHIVFPIKDIQDVIKAQDLSLDSGISIGERISENLEYSVGNGSVLMQNKLFESQRQKNEQIIRLSQEIMTELMESQRDIVYISLDGIEAYMGEVFAKALTIALFHLSDNQRIVLYQCSNDLKKNIFDTMRIFYRRTDIEGMFYGRNIQIVLYSEEFEETVLDLSSSLNTDSVNAYIAHMKCIALEDGYINFSLEGIDLERGARLYVPCDILHKVEINGKIQSIFEHYTESILKNSIQGQEFGCRLQHTHMRLGSTIHIDNFYEAEILFGNRLFVSRFALLIVKDMKEDIKDIPKLTLYGYGTYSESVLVQTAEMIRHLYPEKESVDYIILEREEERRGFLHKDRIRYNRPFQSREQRVEYFKDRKIAIVVLINSTLKTHMRLINLFCEENDIKSTQNTDWLIRNYAVLLVGADDNDYWKLEKGYVKVKEGKGTISPTPQFFIQVDAKYQEPMECEQCFPDNAVAEIPLIEVNAASTIPNQAFGIIGNESVKKIEWKTKLIEEEQNIECLKDEFIYGHVHRNENHFLYYFKTEEICVKQREQIEKSLKNWIRGDNCKNGSRYNIIVSPMHFSNAGFVELVNSEVFGGNAILLRIDFDKEYRCNAYTKYSYLRNYVKQLGMMNTESVVSVHYVDDSIISGRTFHRAKSLIQSIFGLDGLDSLPVQIKIFDKVFVLIDRNSPESRNQYVARVESDFYAFVTVNISSLRNYGDSCVYCNLKKESEFLCGTASTKMIADYWKNCAELKFQLFSLEEYVEKSEEDKEKHFRRLFCTHMSQYVLGDKYHGNDNNQAAYLILKLLNTDYELREKDKYEYFLSYLKCISRPFLVFKKAIKEAIFDIMLVLIDVVVSNKELREIIKGVEAEKPYLGDRKLILQFNKIDKNILQSCDLTKKNKIDLVKLLMKQLTELKSNYIIRPEKMDAIFSFMSATKDQKFQIYYMSLIDRLVGGSSDTTKSVWLDDKIMTSQFNAVPESFRVWVILENTRTYRDGIEKLYRKVSGQGAASKDFAEAVNNRVSKLEKHYDCNRAFEIIKLFEEENSIYLEDYKNGKNNNAKFVSNIEKKIEHVLMSLPNLENVNIENIVNVSRRKRKKWLEIYNFIKESVEEEYEEIHYKDGDGNGAVDKIGNMLSTELDTYQFANFYKLLEDESYYKNKQITDKGLDIITCCLKILLVCNNEEMTIMDKVPLLAFLIKVVLGAQKVQFIIENKADNSLNQWKRVIENRYNKLADKIGCEEKIAIEDKKQYFVIVEKSGLGDMDTQVSDKTKKQIEALEKLNGLHENYVIGDEYDSVLWKLESNQRSVWINIENRSWNMPAQERKCKIARDFRKVMMFYQEFMEKIFNPENDDFINEISHVSKELSIYNSNKVYTHTNDYLKKMLFDKAQGYFQRETGIDELQNYPAYVLRLLADINISTYYRNAMKVDYFKTKSGMSGSLAKWECFSGFLSDGKKFACCVGEGENIDIRLCVSDINYDEQILCRDTPSARQDMILLIYSVILNAAEQNRGKRVTEENNMMQSGAKSVIIVDVCEENGYLVISNECKEKLDIEHIRKKLNHMPESEEDGISLWSFNRYIKKCINSLIQEKLMEIEQDFINQATNKMDMKTVKQWIKNLTGGQYDVQVEISFVEPYYFRVKLPIFMKLYEMHDRRKEKENE